MAIKNQSHEGYLWNISILTIPGREQYLSKLLQSINGYDVAEGLLITIVYNKKVESSQERIIEQKIIGASKKYPVEVYFNQVDTSIAGGRNFQLNISKSPLIVFIDDDVTIHGEIFPILLNRLQTTKLGMIGLPSYISDSDALFKPRTTTPFIIENEIRYMPVLGMFIVSYRKLLVEIGGFNTRRRYWGEWTELNLRMWRNGFPTGYIMDAGFLRHWEEAPDSPTRTLSGREKHVLWGLVCTALEYDAVDINQATEVFWQLIEERYLKYSFGDELSIKNLLQTMLELLPELSAEWSNIMNYKAITRQHPFQFMPFHSFSHSDLLMVIQYANKSIKEYQKELDKARPPQPSRFKPLEIVKKTLGLRKKHL